jgi:hypothetical protein
MIEETPRKTHFGCYQGSQGFHSEGLGGVVPCIKKIHSKFLRSRVGPVRTLTGNKGIGSE